MAGAERAVGRRALDGLAAALREPVDLRRGDVAAALTFGVLPAIVTLATEAPLLWPVLQVALVLIALQAIGGRGRTAAVRAAVVGVGAVLLLLNVAYGASYWLQNTGFNEGFAYHMHPDVLYAGAAQFRLPAILVGLYGATSLGAVLTAAARERKASTGGRVVAGLALVACLAAFPPIRSAQRYLLATVPSAPDPVGARIAAELSFRPDVAGGETRRNLVLIYAEGLERSYFDEARFPGLLPRLDAFRRGNLEFTGIRQLSGTGWTMAGLVSTQCGVPLHSRHGLGGNEFSVFREFLPGATCLADVLRAHGYATAYVGGADTRFAGKDDFLRSHGFDSVLGRTALEASLEPGATHEWGLYDEDLFRFAGEELRRLAGGDDPFALVVLTLDTHHPGGYVSPSCGTWGDGNAILQSVHCADRLISAFIDSVRASPVAGETTVILVSDHLAMRNSAYGILEEKPAERVLTLVVDAPGGPAGARHGPATHFDIAPTVLEAVGFRVEGSWGLGHSLLRHDAGWLAGFAPLDQADHALLREPLADAWDGLWEAPPTATAGRSIRMDLDAAVVEIAGVAYGLDRSEALQRSFDRPAPVAFELDPGDLSLRRIHRPIVTAEALRKALVEGPGSLFLVAAPAAVFGGLTADEDGGAAARPWHLLLTMPDGEITVLRAIDGPVEIPGAAIDSVLAAPRSHQALLARLRALR